jgi:integrase
VLSRLFTFSRRRGYVSINPVAHLEAAERPRVLKSDPRILTAAETRQLIAAASPGSRPIIATLALWGLRLTCGDVDVSAGLIRLRSQLARGADPQRVKLKTDTARRDVTLVPQLGQLLKLSQGVCLGPCEAG